VRSRPPSGYYPKCDVLDRTSSGRCWTGCTRNSVRQKTQKAMTDVFTKAQRSAIMARIRARGNESTEVRTVGILRAAKISGWRRHSKLFGKPDFVFTKAKVALFVDGCFWHGCPKCKRLPKSSAVSAAFWHAKIRRNILRDERVSRELRKAGWRVVRARECQLRAPGHILGRLRALVCR